MIKYELIDTGDKVRDGDLTFNSGTWMPFVSPRVGERITESMVVVRPIKSEPQFIMKVWIDSCGLRANVQHMHTGEGSDQPFSKTYDKPGQLAAIWESFRQELLEFINDFRNKR